MEKPISVKTTVTVPFWPGFSRDEAIADSVKSDQFFKVLNTCGKKISSRELEEAEATCKRAVAMSAELDPARQLERLHAVQLAGDSLFLQRKFPDALHYYQQELHIADNALKSTDAELGDAQHQVGNGLWGTGRKEEAAQLYEKAESTYKQAATHISSVFLKNEYAKKLKLVLSDHSALLRQMDRASEADTLDKEAAAIVIKQDLRDE